MLIVAGGIGLCPVRSMINYILDHRDDFGKFTLFFGTKTPSDLLFEEDLENWRCSSCMQYLETVDKVDRIYFPGQDGNPVPNKMTMPGGMVSFEIGFPLG